MVPPPRGTSSGLVSPEEEYEEEVEDILKEAGGVGDGKWDTELEILQIQESCMQGGVQRSPLLRTCNHNHISGLTTTTSRLRA